MNIKETAKSIGYFILGLAIMVGLFLFIGVIFWGTAKVSAFLYPVFITLSALAIAIFFLIVLPFSLVRAARGAMAVTALILSYVIGATIWMYAFLSLFYFIGFWTLLLLMWFPSVGFIAFFVLLFNKIWIGALFIVLGTVLTFGMRIFAFWLAEKSSDSSYDAEYYEVKNPMDNTMPKYCPKCGKAYDASWKVCLHCNVELLDNDGHSPDIV